MSYERRLSELDLSAKERVSIARYLIINLAKRISGLRWVGQYGSFWNPEVSDPHDIDIAVDIDESSLPDFERSVGSILSRNFARSVDLFPIHIVLNKYGKDKAAALVKAATTLFGSEPKIE